MVVVKGKDKRRGNESDNLEVISHTKGMRTLGGPASGRFAADMRVRVGGYGRPDQTWGVDHPWHKTADVDLHQLMTAKDRMEDGGLVEEKPQGHGLSRAALKRKKKQQKQGKAAPEEPQVVVETTTAAPAKKAAKKTPAAKTPSTKKKSLFDDSDDDDDDKDVTPTAADSDSDVDDAPPAKKAKAADAKPKKQQSKQPQLTKRELKKQQRDREEAEKDLQMLVEEKPVLTVQPLPEREALASQYDAALGTEITTESGLMVRDVQLGRGPLPTPGQMLTVRYRGSLGKGGTQFGKGMLTVKFGQGAVIAGWEEGLATMRAGGKRLLTIPATLAYGPSGKGDKIPPNSTLYFDVDLIRIGTRQRDVLGDDDVPLPKSFMRQKLKEGKAKKEDKQAEDAPKKTKKKRIRY
ncbi:Aste57867_757 [Aphanomyces stellatus]|uniref:peptidylprolyl isomerase n=1 Tax=Aphanomyces stellatus TaxID=120398 RepID=A0A485K7I8_9STRA|nr:hypothetical protein As57867_000756 [Aphanomyces stellatus]VFT77981.1 Aste57867_757 [Aphanomyces stellatus]